MFVRVSERASERASARARACVSCARSKLLHSWHCFTKLATPPALYMCNIPHQNPMGGRNSSLGSAWARCPQRRGFDPPLGKFSGRGDFSLGVNMGSNSIPKKTSFG